MSSNNILKATYFKQKDLILRKELPLSDLLFLKADKILDYKTQMKMDSLRPMISEHTHVKNIVFTKDQKIAFDISYDSKFVLCVWDEIKVLYDIKKFKNEIKRFRKNSFEALDKIKLELIKDKLIP